MASILESVCEVLVMHVVEHYGAVVLRLRQGHMLDPAIFKGSGQLSYGDGWQLCCLCHCFIFQGWPGHGFVVILCWLPVCMPDA